MNESRNQLVPTPLPNGDRNLQQKAKPGNPRDEGDGREGVVLKNRRWFARRVKTDAAELVCTVTGHRSKLASQEGAGEKKKRCMIINSYCWQKGSTLLCTRLHIPGCSFSFKDGSEGTTSAWTNAKSASINFHFCFPTSKLTGLIPPKCA